MTTLYGIPNCDTVKKARNWLDEHRINYRFHDFRADGLSRSQVKSWIADLGLETLINKRSTGWKNLSDTQRADLNEESAVQLILDNPTLIKRPLLETTQRRSVGFKADMYSSLFT